MPESPNSDVGFRIISNKDLIEQPAPARKAPAAPTPAPAELPFRILLASDLYPGSTDMKWDGPRLTQEVDRHNFKELMEDIPPTIQLEIRDVYNRSRKTVAVELSFPSLQAFHPDEIVSQVPVLGRLKLVRSAIEKFGKQQMDQDTMLAHLRNSGLDAEWTKGIRQALSPQEEPEVKAPPTKTDRLLDLIDLGDGDADRPMPDSPAAIVGSFTQAIGGGKSGARPDKGKVAMILTQIDQMMGSYLTAIVEDPAFRALESAWTSLKFLLGRLDFRSGARLEVLPVAKGELVEAMRHQVYEPESSQDWIRHSSGPLSLVVIDMAFSQSAYDIEMLNQLAAMGQEMQVPVLCSASNAFFGPEQGLFSKTPSLNNHLGQDEYVLWRKFRENAASASLAMALPGFILRTPYGDSNAIRIAPLEESAPLTGHASVALAAKIAERVAETGWPTRITGVEADGMDDFPLASLGASAIPLEEILSVDKQGEFRDAGFTTLGCRANRDKVWVSRAVSVNGETEHAELDRILYLSRLSQFIAHTASLGTAADEGEWVALLSQFLGGGTVESAGGQGRAAVTITPPTTILESPVQLTVGLPVG